MIYDQSTNQWVNRPPVQSTAGLAGSAGGVYTRNARPETTVEGRLGGLLNSNNPLMQIGEKRGQQFAASRGLLNSTLAGQAGMRGVMESALPIATADAQLESGRENQNMNALNQWSIMEKDLERQRGQGQGGLSVLQMDSTPAEREERAWRAEQAALDRELTREQMSDRRREGETDRQFQERLAQMGYDFNREMTIGDRDFRRREGESERDFQARMAELGRGYDREQRNLDRQFQRESMDSSARYNMFGQMMSQVFGTVFSSPDFFRDPAAANGFAEFFMGSFGSLFDSFFGRRPGGSTGGGGSVPMPTFGGG